MQGVERVQPLAGIEQTGPAPGQALRFFVPLTKVNEERREVWGLMAEERTDKSGKEIFDYASSKPFVKAWSENQRANSGGKSLGNVRVMHQPIAAGRVIKIDCDDKAKQVPIGCVIDDDREWAKVLKGTYTGFSVGGAYGAVWDDPDQTGVKRYTAVPAEVSLVDNPAMYGAAFQVIKANGARELRKFVGADGRGGGMPGIKAAVTSVHARGSALLGKLRGQGLGDDAPLAKGLYTVRSLADCVMCLDSVTREAAWEAEYERDGSAVPPMLATTLATLGAILVTMTAEEVAELVADNPANDGGGVLAMAVGANAQSNDDTPGAGRQGDGGNRQMHDDTPGIKRGGTADNSGSNDDTGVRKANGDTEDDDEDTKAAAATMGKFVVDTMVAFGTLAKAAGAAGGLDTDGKNMAKKLSKRMQKMHDMASELGAVCKVLGKAVGETPASVSGEVEDMNEKDLRKVFGDVLADEGGPLAKMQGALGKALGLIESQGGELTKMATRQDALEAKLVELAKSAGPARGVTGALVEAGNRSGFDAAPAQPAQQHGLVAGGAHLGKAMEGIDLRKMRQASDQDQIATARALCKAVFADGPTLEIDGARVRAA